MFKKTKNLKEKPNQTKGITLVALIITIIVLIILAGITISIALGQNGIFRKSKKAVDEYQLASEKEAIQMSIASYQLGGDESKLGEELLDKSVQNGSSWKEVVTDDGTDYGTGWNYVGEGTNLESYGDLKHNWLVNYETGEVKELEEGKKPISVKDTVEVTEDLIINIDSAMTDDGVANDENSIEQRLGEGVELHNFTFNNIDGLIDNEFVFDGENDYITIDLNTIKDENNKSWFENGFTFEFYGTIEEGKHLFYDVEHHGKVIDKSDPGITTNNGLFQLTYDNDDNKQQISRVLAFGKTKEGGVGERFFLAFNGHQENTGKFTDNFDYDKITPWWKGYKITKTDNSVHYYTVAIKASEDYSFTQSFYEDGELIQSGELNKYLMEVVRELEGKYITIGGIEIGYDYNVDYPNSQASLSKIYAKCLRLYNKGLTDEQIKKNYEKTTDYHKLMEKESE